MSAAAAGSNGFDGEQIAGYLDTIARADDDLDKLKASHMTACKKPRGKIRETMKSAKEAGLNMASFRATVAADRARRKHEKLVDKLEPDDRMDYDAMCQAIGGLADLPLGEAALAKAKRSGDEAIDRLGR